METLSELLINEGYDVICTSDKTNKIVRLLEMCWAVIKNRNSIDFVLIDTFSTFNFYYALITAQLARLFSLKYIPILHGGHLPNRLKTSRYFSKLIFSNSFLNVTPSIYLQEEFKKQNYSTHFIPNSIPIHDYKFKKRTNFKPNLLWVRAFENTYNPQLAIKVLALLKAQFIHVELCMVGPDKDGSLSEVKKLATQLNVINEVKFTGVLTKEQWHQLSEGYDLFINTTTIDNMPVSVIESMALGLPIVSTNVGGMPYLIEHNKNGILVNTNNENEMANAIIDLVHNPMKTMELSKNARNKSETFDIEIVKQEWLKILNEHGVIN